MTYRMKAGVLYGGKAQDPLVRLEGRLCTREKQIVDGMGQLILRAVIRETEASGSQNRPREGHTYLLEYPSGGCYAQAWPVCDDQEGFGPPPLNQMPRIDHARVRMGEQEYLLIMQNSRTYGLLDRSGKKLVQIEHRGVTGGWQIETWQEFTPPFLCGLFVFCRYLERENELMIV